MSVAVFLKIDSDEQVASTEHSTKHDDAKTSDLDLHPSVMKIRLSIFRLITLMVLR